MLAAWSGAPDLSYQATDERDGRSGNANSSDASSGQNSEVGLVVKKPVTKIGEAARRRTMQGVIASIALNFDSPSVDGSHTNCADALII